ncbi:hypothetical protein BDR04DRAFT_1120381 [Suillus decipiens]|nr:hypothetical protein BDR04DRAFT_1120381 [Suillus decipiens]
MYDFNCSHQTLSTTLSLSYEMQPTTIPDMKVSVIRECAFTQDTNLILHKIKNEITTNPEVLMVIMVLIDKHHPYHLPEWDEPININDHNNELLTCGTLFPNQYMDEFEAMIKKGMQMIQNCLAAFQQKVAPDSNISALPSPNTLLIFYWNQLLTHLAVAVDDTAYEWYHSWYNLPA